MCTITLLKTVWKPRELDRGSRLCKALCQLRLLVLNVILMSKCGNISLILSELVLNLRVYLGYISLTLWRL